MKGTTRANLGETVRPLYAKDRILNVVARKCNQEETGSETEKQDKDRKWAKTLKSIPANLQAEVGLENAVRYRKDRLRKRIAPTRNAALAAVTVAMRYWACPRGPSATMRRTRSCR